MDKLRKEALQITKEIVVKFIETQRVSPANVKEVFPQVYRVVLEAIATDGDPESLRPEIDRESAPGSGKKSRKNDGPVLA